MTNLHTQAVVPSIPSYRLIPLTQGQFAMVDAADYDWLNQWNWFAHWDRDTKSYYARRNIGVQKMKRTPYRQKTVTMNAFIVKPRKGKVADHKSGITLDNRRQNLREATTRQNAINRCRRCDNKSGHVGVYFHVRKGRYESFISVGGKRLCLGYSDQFERAVALRETAEHKYFRSFRR